MFDPKNKGRTRQCEWMDEERQEEQRCNQLALPGSAGLCVTHLALEKLRSKRKIERGDKETNDTEKRQRIIRGGESSTESEEDDEVRRRSAVSVLDYLRDPKTRELLDSSDSLDEIMLNMMETYQKTSAAEAESATAASAADSRTSSSVDTAALPKGTHKIDQPIRLDYDHDLKYSN